MARAEREVKHDEMRQLIKYLAAHHFNGKQSKLAEKFERNSLERNSLEEEFIGEEFIGQNFLRGAPPHTPLWGVAPDPTGALPQTPT